MIFKFICGAANDDINEVKQLIDICSQAKVDIIDVSPAMLKYALKFQSKDLKICLSVGLNDDIHTFKAKIDDLNCIECSNCIEICPQQAIGEDFKVVKDKCIGCSLCLDICPASCITIAGSDTYSKIDYNNLSADMVELHASSPNTEKIIETFKEISKNFKGALSVCLSRKFLSNEQLKKLIIELKKIANREEFYIQADGNPMRGANNDYKTTLETLAFASLIEDLNVKIILSGGVNSKTPDLLKLYEIKAQGIAFGSYIRNIIKNKTQEESIELIKELVLKCKTL